MTKLPLDLMRGKAAMAIYYANNHEKSAEIIEAMLKWTKHSDPRELTRKECESMLQIAEQYGYVDPANKAA